MAAIGAPFGLDATVTAGIVSAKRYMPGSAGTPVIQTDVAINQGSSGGPLFNLKGEVVGIELHDLHRDRGVHGNLVCSSDRSAMQIADELRSRGGHIVRGQIGAHIQEVSVGLARAFGRTSADGALVTRVARASDAQDGGCCASGTYPWLRDGCPSASPRFTSVAPSAPGTRPMLDAWRDGGALRLSADVAAVRIGGAAPLRRPGGPPAHGDRLGPWFSRKCA